MNVENSTAEHFLPSWVVVGSKSPLAVDVENFWINLLERIEGLYCSMARDYGIRRWLHLTCGSWRWTPACGSYKWREQAVCGNRCMIQHRGALFSCSGSFFPHIGGVPFSYYGYHLSLLTVLQTEKIIHKHEGKR